MLMFIRMKRISTPTFTRAVSECHARTIKKRPKRQK